MVQINFELDTQKVPDLLNQIAKVTSGTGGVLQPAWKAIGLSALTIIQRNFVDQGARVGGWQRLSPVTVILRRRGRGAKITDKASLEAKRGKVKILQDTGLLLSSFSAGRKDNVFGIESLGVTVGSANPNAKKHHQGGPATPFKFDIDKQARFKQNVAKKVGGKGNPFYYRWWAVLQNKMDGNTYPLPKRRLVFPFNSSEKARFVKFLAQHINRMIKGQTK